mmetsp:Transcript_61861/g.135296  ORF Transcript_61861/g.135296 Transcript_61861/m.135296 type:complete len:820 (-) Transcript_61861:421-2880(-)|eukprot:CAMPEP_0206530620 /NCGR_PEP_ID=MMETSP0325_2-20121206/3281_1 /ASSEMBLY_ACC=CAM_ASM_000347 /TAXON_ID=2866 /ORGANISM="Crypthecodinium cohnii, Strain Seligo" /LENGTH=819 /DNA_ID=CAMNT_0054026713 /DNA_START=41 /DNA_END=2500 /DNA_ORIENTATION=-
MKFLPSTATAKPSPGKESSHPDASRGNSISRIVRVLSELVPTHANTTISGAEASESHDEIGHVGQDRSETCQSDLSVSEPPELAGPLRGLFLWSKSIPKCICTCSPVTSLLRLYWRRRRHIKFMFFATILFIHIVSIFMVLSQTSVRARIWGWPSPVFTLAAMISLNVPYCCWLTFEAMRRDTSVPAWQASLLFLIYWALQTVATLAKTFDCRWLWILQTMTEPGKYMLTVLCITWRIGMAEMGFQTQKGCAKFIVAWLALLVPMALVRLILWATLGIPDYHSVIDLLELSTRILSFFCIYYLCRRSLQNIMKPLTSFPARLQERLYLNAEVVWAEGILSDLKQTETWLCCAGVIEHGIWLSTAIGEASASTFVRSSTVLFELPSNMILIANLIVFLNMYNKFQKDRPAFPESPRRDEVPHQIFEEMKSSKNAAYQKTVHDLAQRFITAAELLEFYEKLRSGASGMTFEPEIHCTNDVVRAVIAPATCSHGSEQSGVPYTQLLQERRDELQDQQPQLQTISSGMGRFAGETAIYAQRMVTHEWRNLFVNLVAAVLADALNEEVQSGASNERRMSTTYGHLRSLLMSESGIESIRNDLEKVGSRDLRYWVCTFCVNQHRANPPPEPPRQSPEYQRYKANQRDTATKKYHPSCTCRNRRIWGKDDCEMDKFDHMMALLKTKVPELSHVVVTGKNFEIFGRVWCVAELVQAHCSQIKQNVCIISQDVLDANTGDIRLYTQLAMLSIADCSAARESDKERIMAKVRDTCGIEEFDAQLQATIFGRAGLLGRTLLGFDAIHAAARVGRRAKLAARDQLGVCDAV